MTSAIEQELEEMKEIAEGHAFSVRQCIVQRSRLFGVFKMAGRVASFDDESRSLSAWQSLVAAFKGGRQSNTKSRLAKVFSLIEASHSQFSQDILALLIARGKRDGYFVEFGACDGVLISNSLLLEQEFGWKGILSEPSPYWQESLRKNRTCSIETRCVWSESGKTLLFGEMADDKYMTESGVLETTLIQNRDLSNQYEVQTISLRDMLREHKAPKFIDLLSIDTEGSELKILETAPFDEYEFGFICVEHKTDLQEKPIRNLLKRHGYKQVLRDISGHDGFYIRKDSRDAE